MNNYGIRRGGNKMGEVKIYRGTVNGEKNVLITEHWDGIDNRWRILFPQNGIRYCDFEQAKDLTELELHEAGTGVWLADSMVGPMAPVWLKLAIADAKEKYSGSTNISVAFYLEKILWQILCLGKPQLSDTGKATEETFSGTGSLLERFQQYEDHKSPAKVGFDKLISFAIAVLKMPEKETLGYMPAHSYRFASGYNAFRAKVHQLAKEEMGVADV